MQRCYFAYVTADGLLTTGEAADMLGKHRTTVARMVRRGVLVPALTIKAGFLFRLEDVVAHISGVERHGAQRDAATGTPEPHETALPPGTDR